MPKRPTVTDGKTIGHLVERAAGARTVAAGTFSERLFYRLNIIHLVAGDAPIMTVHLVNPSRLSFGMGVPESKGDLFQVFGNRRGTDRSRLGLGLSIARKAVRAHGGEITIRNMPGKGCVFVIEVPLATAETVPQSVS